MIVIVWKEYEEGPTPSDVAYNFFFNLNLCNAQLSKIWNAKFCEDFPLLYW
jgi:hypothetical protein